MKNLFQNTTEVDCRWRAGEGHRFTEGNRNVGESSTVCTFEANTSGLAFLLSDETDTLPVGSYALHRRPWFCTKNIKTRAVPNWNMYVVPLVGVSGLEIWNSLYNLVSSQVFSNKKMVCTWNVRFVVVVAEISAFVLITSHMHCLVIIIGVMSEVSNK